MVFPVTLTSIQLSNFIISVLDVHSTIRLACFSPFLNCGRKGRETFVNTLVFYDRLIKGKRIQREFYVSAMCKQYFVPDGTCINIGSVFVQLYNWRASG